jgi:uncharacterized iron-regulated protein
MKRPSFFSSSLVAACAFSLLNACSGGGARPSDSDETSGDRILDTRSGTFVSRNVFLRRATAARFLILGESHDNAIHHRLQAQILDSLLRTGRRPALAMEQFDREHQAALNAASNVQDAERIAETGRFDRKGWHWPFYKPLLELAAANGLRIIAANFSREEARALIKAGGSAPALPPVTAAVRAALEQDIVNGHCGIRPSAPILSGMIEAQRARDAAMAAALESAGPDGAVLIAGAGHARRDRGAPSYLNSAAQGELVSVGFMEIKPQEASVPSSYAGLYDFVWLTSPAKREDPCKNLRLPDGMGPK